MPVYEYRCPDCLRTWSRLVAFDHGGEVCKLCATTAVKVILTAPGVIFSGEGWTTGSEAWKGNQPMQERNEP